MKGSGQCDLLTALCAVAVLLTQSVALVMDAMSDAIDNAEVMLYAVSELYKESGNCRLEANYAHQQDLDMLPLMVQEGYQAKGWLGLMLGTRLWYAFYGCEEEDDSAFERRVDPVVREIGDRGRPAPVSEGVPPSAPAPAPEPAPAPAPEPAPAPKLATPKLVPQTAAPTAASTPDRSFSPSMQPSPQPVALQPAGERGPSGSFAELSMFLKEQQQLLEKQQVLLLEQQQEAHQARQEVEAKMEAKIEEQRQQMQALMAPQEAISTAQIDALNARLEGLHAARLLTDEELFAVEDCVADFLEAKGSFPVVTVDLVNSNSAVGKAHKLVVLSAGVASDAMFARQVRRKFV